MDFQKIVNVLETKSIDRCKKSDCGEFTMSYDLRLKILFRVPMQAHLDRLHRLYSTYVPGVDEHIVQSLR